MNSFVQFENVGRSYVAGTWAVKGFNLKIAKGEFVSLLGPSGCGKTTCLRMLAGLELNTEGTIQIANEVVSDPQKKIFVPPEKRRLGMVFQSYAVWPHMDVLDNVAYPLRRQGVPSDQIEDRVMKTLEMVEMKELAKRKPSQLSGGQQQRVALARGLVAEPRVLLLDEPLSNLDVQLREKMRRDIRGIQQKLGLTMVYVTHDQLEARTMSDRMVVMNKGVIVQIGTPEELSRNPQTDFVRDFLRH